mgnify:CR=1 FL=1
MKSTYRTGFGFAGYLFIGTSAVLIPLTMPFITDEYMETGLALAAIGLIFPARSIGSILGNMLSGITSDLMGRWRVVWLSAFFIALALVLTALAKMWLLFILGFVFVSVAQGSLATGINAMIADDHREDRARALNVLHGIYGAGAAISPLIIGFLLNEGMHWRWALAGTGLIWLGYGLLAMLVTRSSGSPQHEVSSAKLDLSMLRQRPFLALFLIAFFYNAIAFSLLGWIALFLRQSTDASTLVSVLTISLFYVALTSGRFICAAYTERLGYARTLLILAVGVVVTYPLVLMGINILVVSGVFLVGLSLFIVGGWAAWASYQSAPTVLGALR